MSNFILLCFPKIDKIKLNCKKTAKNMNKILIASAIIALIAATGAFILYQNSQTPDDGAIYPDNGITPAPDKNAGQNQPAPKTPENIQPQTPSQPKPGTVNNPSQPTSHSNTTKTPTPTIPTVPTTPGATNTPPATPATPIEGFSLQTACTSASGKWIAQTSECENIDSSWCAENLGTFNECASPCRNDPQAQICIEMCIPVCKL